MGLCVNVDIETSAGPTQEMYVRIDNVRLNKVAATIKYVVSYWIDKDHAMRFVRTYVEQARPGAVGILAREMVYYKDENSSGKEVTLPIAFDTYPVSKQEIKVPIYENKPVKVEVPYVSFNEAGEEITKYRTVEEYKKEQVDSKVEIRHIIDNSKINNLQQFCYEDLAERLTEFFPKEAIENA